jgi:hypothetical protein
VPNYPKKERGAVSKEVKIQGHDLINIKVIGKGDWLERSRPGRWVGNQGKEARTYSVRR